MNEYPHLHRRKFRLQCLWYEIGYKTWIPGLSDRLRVKSSRMTLGYRLPYLLSGACDELEMIIFLRCAPVVLLSCYSSLLFVLTRAGMALRNGLSAIHLKWRRS